MTSPQRALLALSLVSGALVAEASGAALATWTLGVECDLTSSGSTNYWGISKQMAAGAADQICADLIAYLSEPRSKSVLSAWAYVANQPGTGGTLTFRIGRRPAPGQCHRLQLEFHNDDDSKVLFDEPLYKVGDWKCSRDPKQGDFKSEIAAGFLRELQAQETTIQEHLQDRVPLLSTEVLGYIRLPPNAKRADFFCCQLEWERYRKLRSSLFELHAGARNTSLVDPMDAQGMEDPGQEKECSTKHLVLEVCEDPSRVDAILKQSRGQSVRTAILLKSYVEPTFKTSRACDNK